MDPNIPAKSSFRDAVAQAGSAVYVGIGAVTTKMTKITNGTESLLNLVRSINGSIIGIIETPVALMELQKLAPSRILPYIPTLDVDFFAGFKPHKIFWGHLKDILTPFEFLSKLKTFTDGKTYKQATTLKKASMVAQLVQKTTEALFLIPAKYNILPFDLGKVCASIGTSIGGLTVFKELCVLVSSTCNFLHGNNEIARYNGILEKRNLKSEHLHEFEFPLTREDFVKYLNKGKERALIVDKDIRKSKGKKEFGNNERVVEEWQRIYLAKYERARQENLHTKASHYDLIVNILIGGEEEKNRDNISKILDYKRAKNEVLVHNDNIVVGKINAGRYFDVAKIAIVSCGLISGVGLTVLMGTQALAALTVTSYISGWAVGATGFYRTMYMAWWDADCKQALPAYAS